jgi:hypothetical protein
MKVEFHPLTADDFNQASDFYERNQPGISKLFRADFAKTIDSIIENPLIFAEVNGIRRALLRRFPYSVLYRPTPPSTPRKIGRRDRIDTHTDVLTRPFQCAGVVYPAVISVGHIPAGDMLFRTPARLNLALGPGHRVGTSPVVVLGHLVAYDSADGCACDSSECPAVTMDNLVTHHATDNRSRHGGDCGRWVSLPNLFIPADLLIYGVAHGFVYRTSTNYLCLVMAGVSVSSPYRTADQGQACGQQNSVQTFHGEFLFQLEI